MDHPELRESFLNHPDLNPSYILRVAIYLYNFLLKFLAKGMIF